MIQDLLTEWEIAVDQLKYWKKLELDLRNQLVDSESDYTAYIKVTRPIRYNVDPVILETNWRGLSPTEKEAFVFKPTITAKSFNSVKGSREFYEAIEVKQGQPSVTKKKT